MNKRQWYRFAVQDVSDVAELLIYDVIGYDFWTGEGVTAKQFVKDLAALPESVATIKVRVNSPGGDVFDAVAIANALRQHKARVEMSIEGLAASAATIITCAGDVIRIGDNALMMIHNPWSWAIGESKDMRKAADDLDKIRGSIIATYRWVSALSDEALSALMDATTWMDADEAIANGFATEKAEGLRAAALLDRKALAKLSPPEKYLDRIAALAKPTATPPSTPEPMATAQVLAACKAAGFLELAEGLLGANATADQVTARLAEAKEIRGLCVAAKLPDLAGDLIEARTPVLLVKQLLTNITARLDGQVIDTSLQPDAGRQTAKASVGAAYAKFTAPVKGA